MARMTLQDVHGDGERRRLPLSERIVDENLGSYRHVPQSREPLRSATADAEVAESRSALTLLRTSTKMMLRRRAWSDSAADRRASV